MVGWEQGNMHGLRRQGHEVWQQASPGRWLQLLRTAQPFWVSLTKPGKQWVLGPVLDVAGWGGGGAPTVP